MKRASASFLGLAVGGAYVAGEISSNTTLGGSLLPQVNPETWEGWTPDEEFAERYKSWPDRKVPQDIQVWCKGFIPKNASSEVIHGHPVMPIKGPMGVPIPGLLGQCAGIDGRSWSNEPPSDARPKDSRFWAWMEIKDGKSKYVTTGANCGMSHNYCCNPDGCLDGSSYGEQTCESHCPDSQMNVLKLACWTEEGTDKGQTWAQTGEQCIKDGQVLAAKAYIQGRGGNPCGKVMGVSPPVASWDVGVAIFPKKRKVTLTGYVDDAPSYECYAKAKDDNVWGPTVTLAQIPMDLKSNIAIELAGYADRPINPEHTFFDLPEASVSGSTIVV